MSDSETRTSGVVIEGMDTIVTEVLHQLERRGKDPELPTGIPALDEAIWGIHRSEVMVIAARPGEGKTTLALQICSHLANRSKRVLFVSLEMTKHQLVERWLVQLTQSNAWMLRTGQQIEEFKAKLVPLQRFFEEVDFRCTDGCGYNIPELNHLVGQFVKHGNGAPDVLVIDFIQLISVEGLQKFDAIAEYIRQVKELAMKHKMAVILCSQVNREGGRDNVKQPPRLINLKGSGSIEELADCVLTLWWQELGKEEQPEGTRYWISVEKQRHGPPGQRIPVKFDAEHLTFSGVEDVMEGWHAPQDRTALILNEKDLETDHDHLS